MEAHELANIMPHASIRNCTLYAGPLTDAMAEFGIDTPQRQAFFLAQVAHESGSLHYVLEIASGKEYENRRTDLGNTEPGDGPRFKGRGLIQTTGRRNYQRVADKLGIDCVNHPELLEQPENAARSAALFWHDNNLNTSADADDIRVNTRIINGGYNGMLDRQIRLAEAKQALGVA